MTERATAGPEVSPPGWTSETDMPARDRWSARAAVLALSSFTIAAVLLGVVHLDPELGGIDSVTAMLSDYGLVRGWWLWDLSLVATSVGSLAVLVAMRRQAILARGAAMSCMGLWCGCVLLVAAFTKDPQGGAVTLTGKIHLYATALSCASLPIAGLALGRQHHARPGWQSFARWARWLAAASIPLFLPFILPFAGTVLLGSRALPSLPTGLIERLMAVLDLAVLVTFALWSWHATRNPAVPARSAPDQTASAAAA